MVASLLTALPRRAAAQVLAGPGETTETAFRREIRGHWFGWLAAREEGDHALAKAKTEEILKYTQKIGIRRLSDLALSATLLGRRDTKEGKASRAELAFQTAIALDPDLPEARWGKLYLSASSKKIGSLPGEFLAAARTTLVDHEARRILLARSAILLTLALAATGAGLVLMLILIHVKRYIHDLYELGGRFTSGPLQAVLAGAAFLAPLFLTLDVAWLGLYLFVVMFGYAELKQQITAAVGLALILPVLPVMDRTGYELAIAASPILRGGEAREESRYDQRLLDDLEAVKAQIADDVDIHFLMGRLYQGLGQNDRAVAEYTRASQISKNEDRCLVNRGNIRFVDGDFSSAQEDYLEAKSRNPRNVLARYNLSLVFAETFRTTEAVEALNDARALDAKAVASFQASPSIVKVVSHDFTTRDARIKIDALERDARSSRVLGHYRTASLPHALLHPFVFGILLAIGGAIALDRVRQKEKGYASECQKCGRTFCRRCKPPGQSPLLCSQCVHVYLKKDGVAIETALQKVEEVKARRTYEDRIRMALNVVLPGSAAFRDSRIAPAILSLMLFALGILALFWRDVLVASPRPSVVAPLAGSVFWLLVAAAGWVWGFVTSARTTSTA